MTVVASYLYRNGRRVREVAIEERAECAGDHSEFVWIGLVDPTEAELRTLQETYGLHPLAIEDALNADQLPKVDIYNEQLFVVARTAQLDNDVIRYGETAIFVGLAALLVVVAILAITRRRPT